MEEQLKEIVLLQMRALEVLVSLHEQAGTDVDLVESRHLEYARSCLDEAKVIESMFIH